MPSSENTKIILYFGQQDLKRVTRSSNCNLKESTKHLSWKARILPQGETLAYLQGASNVTPSSQSRPAEICFICMLEAVPDPGHWPIREHRYRKGSTRQRNGSDDLLRLLSPDDSCGYRPPQPTLTKSHWRPCIDGVLNTWKEHCWSQETWYSSPSLVSLDRSLNFHGYCVPHWPKWEG